MECAGKARELRGSADALSTVTGIVDGTGSVGAAIGMLAIPWGMSQLASSNYRETLAGQRNLGWSSVFYGFILMVLCTAACLVPLLWREWKERRAGESSWSRAESRDTVLSERFEPLEEESDETVDVPVGAERRPLLGDEVDI